MDGTEKIKISDFKIEILNRKTSNLVMYNDERIVQKEKKLVDIITSNGGDILEIGFGLHIASDFIQSNPNVKSHTIIEIHPKIYENALKWGEGKKNVKILLGNWIDLIPIRETKFDGILQDTYSDNNIPNFLNKIKLNCKIGTIVGLIKHPRDGRLNAIKSEEYNFELKYTTYNGFDFYKENKTTTLL